MLSGVSRQLFNWVQIIKSNCTGGYIKLAEMYYSILHVVLLIVYRTRYYIPRRQCSDVYMTCYITDCDSVVKRAYCDGL